MNYFPKFILHLNSISLLGITLLLGLVGGELARRVRYLPQISGYILVGFLIGPGGFNIVNQHVLANANFFIDISLSLILFELGRYLDFTWLKQDKAIVALSLAESFLTFFFIFSILYLTGMSAIASSLAASIAVATSAAVVMMVAYDLAAEGPVTRRALILTSLNNLYALILFTILIPIVRPDVSTMTVAFTVYRLLGSILLGIIIFYLILGMAYATGKDKENQFILYVGAILLAIGSSYALNFSSMLTLFSFGVAARNLDKSHALIEINFDWLARLFFVLLFVVTGIHLKLQGLLQATWIVITFVCVRVLAKIIGIWLFSKSSRLTKRQSLCLSFTLFPMAGIAIGMSNMIIDFNPDFGHRLLLIITAAVAILNIIGPITVQLAFMLTGESLKEKSLRG